MHSLPIDALLPEVIAALRDASRLVLQAEPGAGKTTRVPAALLDAGIAGEREVMVVEPRRIAARAAAAFVARERGGPVGGEVGYRVRFERRGGRSTRLWFVTEGVFGRDLVRDPFLESVGAVVLDEFHERHLEGDLALAVVRELQDTVRPDLKLVVMSATLESDALARYLGGAPVVRSTGRAFPVDVVHLDGDPRERATDKVVRGVTTLLGDRDDGGDLLVFLPGPARSAGRPPRSSRSPRRAASTCAYCTARRRWTSRSGRWRADRAGASCWQPTWPRRRSPSTV